MLSFVGAVVADMRFETLEGDALCVIGRYRVDPLRKAFSRCVPCAQQADGTAEAHADQDELPGNSSSTTPVTGETTSVGVTADIYHAFASVWIHHDHLGWSRVNWMLAIEGAGLAAYFRASDRWGQAALLAATLLLSLMWLMRRKDEADRHHAESIVKAFHEQLGRRDLRFTAQSNAGTPKATDVLRWAFGLTLAANLLLVLFADSVGA